MAVTSYTPADNKQPGRPWLLLHDHRLYVSCDASTGDYLSGSQEVLATQQGYVSVYELTQAPQYAAESMDPYR